MRRKIIQPHGTMRRKIMYNTLQLIGGLILAVGYIPQIMQLIKTRSSYDLNLKTYIALTIGISLMEIYALNLVQNGFGTMFAVTNTVSLILVATITVLIICLRREKKMSDIFAIDHPKKVCYNI